MRMPEPTAQGELVAKGKLTGQSSNLPGMRLLNRIPEFTAFVVFAIQPASTGHVP
jgi:hypothetical protein